MDVNADFIIKTLISNGYEAYYVGGCVRTIEHNRIHNDNITIKDFDIVTNASFKDMEKLFKDIEDRGESFSVAIVRINGEEYEVARYRGEEYPNGGSTRPDKVFDVDTLEEDLLRRDFKMNGLVQNINGHTIDLVGGSKDIKNRIISTIGEPNKRFLEDPLRILRGLRFASQLNYNIDPDTLGAMINNIHLLSSIPHSRVEGEFSKIVNSKYPFKGLTYLQTIYKTSSKNIQFKNTILNKTVNLIPSLLSLPNSYFDNLVKKVRNDLGTVGFFYSLYKGFNSSFVEKELINMQITNKEVTQKVKLLIENKNIIIEQTEENLLKLVRNIKTPNKREILDEFLRIYSEVDGVSLEKLKKMTSRPLFIEELPYNGHDIIDRGMQLGYAVQGKLIGEILELGREKAVLGANFNLDNIFLLLISKMEA